MMKISHFLSIAVLGLCSFAASAATVWQPTDTETDFIQFDAGGLSTYGGTLALFDNGNFGDTANALVIGSNGGQVTFTANGSDWTANSYDSNNNLVGGPITLTGNKSFSLGMTWDGGATWIADQSITKVTSASYDTYLIAFGSTQVKGQTVTASTLGVDLQPVPVPAAAWLFGTGLLGLVGVARRRA